MSEIIDYRTVFDASANAYMLLDRELRYVAANHAYLELTASRLPELLGRHVFDAFPSDPDDPNNESRLLVRESFERVLRTRQRHVIALLSYCVARVPGGALEERLWSCTHQPILDAQGEVAFILQNTADVTELALPLNPAGPTPERITQAQTRVLRRAEETAANNRELGHQIADLRSVFDQAPGFVCFLRGPEHVFELANRAYQDLVGHRDLVGKPLRQALPDVAGQGYYELLDQVFETGKAFVGHNMRLELERGEGRREEVLLDFVYQPIVSGAGTVVGVFVQGHDMTLYRLQEQRQRFLMRAGECLASAASQLDTALCELARAAAPEFSDWAVVDLFEAGSYRRLVAVAGASEAALAEQILNYPPKIAESSPLYRAVSAKKITLIEHVDAQLQSAAAHDAEHRELMTQIGVHSLLVVPLYTAGHHFGALTFGLAKSARRYGSADVAAAEELARMCAIALDNARLLHERTRLLQSEQAARERAEAANQAKDDFLALLGHELRNPLAPILTAIELMKLQAAGAPSREQIIIERQANHMVRLVDDLLDVSRIARGKVQLRQGVTDIASTIAHAVDVASPLLERQRHELILDVPREGLHVFGDEARLSQILANLLTNAARYTPLHGRIELSARAQGPWAVIRVADNGIGITDDLLPRIFDLFVQGPQRLDRAEGGLGLGLTLVRNLVTMHGGTVEAHSRGKDQGSEFVVRLPLLQERPSELALATRHRTTATSRQGCKVLIVDDNSDAAELLSELLSNRGHDTAVAFDGPSALLEAQRFEPAVAILDIGLPVMDGYELAAQLRAAAGAQAPQLIALTGYGNAHDRARSVAAGFFAHLVKPVDTDVLLEAVTSAQERAGSA